MKKNDRIFIIGDKSIIGKNLIQYFKSKGFSNIFSESDYRLNLVKQRAVDLFFKRVRPTYVFLTHIRSGGIIANIKYPAVFIYENLQIQNNIIHNSYKFGVKKLLFIASSCVYPKDSPQPIKEEYLLTGRLEKTSEPYAISKIAGMKMCESYSKQYGINCFCVIPATIYGPNDNFDLNEGHVLPSLIKRIYEAKIKEKGEVIVWGSGKPMREFLYIEDFVNACIFLMENYNKSDIINVGYGTDISIKELALLIKDIIGFKGKISFDKSKPDGVWRKLLDSAKIKKIGWKPEVPLKEGIKRTYEWYKTNLKNTK